MQNDNTIVPFGTKLERQRIRQLANRISKLDYSNSDDVPCLIEVYGEHLHILNENHLPWLGGHHRARLFDMDKIDTLQGKTFVKYARQFVEPLVQLVG